MDTNHGNADNGTGRLARLVVLAVVVVAGGCSSIGKTVDPMPYAPPAGARLETITVEGALASPQRFTGGVTITCSRKVNGETVAIISALGQNKQVPVPGEAVFYAVSNRSDVVVMHDRFIPWLDTIRIYNFSPTGVRERVCSHRVPDPGYSIRRFDGFQLAYGQIAVTEELAAFHPSPLQTRHNRWSVPLD
ncbi:MAG: hypothetical protein PHU85_04800 [Phycisphaerae bacterium]|nr:hypothetical protein [Phycisphaerae bacterium]